MPETIRVPFSRKNIYIKTGLYLAVLGMLAFVAHRMGEWNEATWLVVAIALLIFHLLYRMHTVAARGGDCMVLAPDALTVNCWETPFTATWDSMHGTEFAAVHTVQRGDSIRILFYEDKLPEGLTEKNAKIFPREDGTRYIRIDCTFVGMNPAELKTELDRRIVAAGGKGDVGPREKKKKKPSITRMLGAKQDPHNDL